MNTLPPLHLSEVGPFFRPEALGFGMFAVIVFVVICVIAASVGTSARKRSTTTGHSPKKVLRAMLAVVAGSAVLLGSSFAVLLAQDHARLKDWAGSQGAYWLDDADTFTLLTGGEAVYTREDGRTTRVHLMSSYDHPGSFMFISTSTYPEGQEPKQKPKPSTIPRKPLPPLPTPDPSLPPYSWDGEE